MSSPEAPSITSNNILQAIEDNWIAFDLEWEIEPKPLAYTVASYDQHPYNTDFTSGTSIPPVQDYHKIVTFGFEDSYGNNGTLDISDFANRPNPPQAFLIAIKAKLLHYKYCFAWGSKAIKHNNEENGKLEGINGDLHMLDINFRINGISSIVRYDKFSGIPYIKNNNYGSSSNKISTTVDIDLLQVLAKPLIKHVIFKNKYKSLRIHEVATSLLGYGKLDNKSGASITEMSVAERKAYCLHDAHIVADLIKIKNGDIMKIMQVIANHTSLKIEEVCHKGMTSIWNKILNDAISKRISIVGYGNIPSSLRRLYCNSNYQSSEKCEQIEYHLDAEFEEEEEDEIYEECIGEQNQHFEETSDDDCHTYPKDRQPLEQHSKPRRNAKESYKKYKGAIVFEPQRGLHSDVHLFDVTSLYPTIIIKYNLSPETVNCSCCKNNPKARELFTSEILKDCNYIPAKEGCYWICQCRQGLFAKILQKLTEQRIYYKNAGLEIESQAIKAIINSGYGVFGHPYFKYYDPRVAELATAFGRHTLIIMQYIAHSFGFGILYGDTDSLFLNKLKSVEDTNKFISECKSKLGVNVGHEKTFSKLILVSKKHYIGILSDPQKGPVIKGMEGLKSDRPEFIRMVFRQLIDDIKYDNNPIPNLKHALDDLTNKQVPSEQLAIYLILRKNPEEYGQDCKQKRLGTKLGLRKGDTLVYYKCDINEITFDSNKKDHLIQKRIFESENLHEISCTNYQKMLINSVKDVLQILGYDIYNDLLLDKTQCSQINDINTADSIGSEAQIEDNPISNNKQRRQMVSEGVDTFLSLFAVVGQRLFPRAIMAKCTKRQIVAHNKEEIIRYFAVSNYQDCRINGYPALLKDEEQDYKKEISNLDLFTPNILFIDLDDKKFSSDEELQRTLKQILKHIAYLLHDCNPLVLWSGHGYHIIIAVNCKGALAHFQELVQYTSEPSKEFLQFAERYLSLNKADSANNPSLKSCLLRVPYTFNSKCLEEGADIEVKIVQQWDRSTQPPSIDNLLVEFQTFLIDKKLKAELKQNKLKCRHSKNAAGNRINNKNIIPWIERLFQIAIEHNREYCVWRIFAPYFINIRKLEYIHTYYMIKDWLDRCNSIRKLDFDADYQIKYTLNKATHGGYLPISFDNLKIDNPNLCKQVSSIL